MAVIEMAEGRYYLAMWYIPSNPLYKEDHNGKQVNVDWLACAWREEQADAPWHIDYRFRYYLDNRVFNSADERSGAHAQGQAGMPEDELMQGVSMLAKMIARRLQSRSEALEIRGDMQRAWSLMREHPAFHMRTATPEEIEKLSKGDKL